MAGIPTSDERTMHRAQISVNDLVIAIAFIDAALALERIDPKWNTSYTHLALVVSAVIYYARPFGMNEGPLRGRRRRRTSRSVPPLQRINIGPISHAIPSRAGQRLHHSVIRCAIISWRTPSRVTFQCA